MYNLNQQFNIEGDRKPSKKIIIGVVVVIVVSLLFIILVKIIKKPKVSEQEVSEKASQIQSQINDLNNFGQDLSADIGSFDSHTEDLSDFAEDIEGINKEMENPK